MHWWPDMSPFIPIRNHGREIFWRTLFTKDQAQMILDNIDNTGCKVPKKGMMQVLSFPDQNLVGYVYWTKAVNEDGQRMYAYELERNIT